MITEIQLADNRLHFLYLQRAINEIARSAGLCQRDSEDMGKAISQVCAVSLKSMRDVKDGRVRVTLAADSSSFSAEIVDRYTVIAPTRPGECFDDNSYSQGLENTRVLVDSLECIRGMDETTFRLVKCSSRDSSVDFTRPTVPVAG